jgi:hypothetical protein
MRKLAMTCLGVLLLGACHNGSSAQSTTPEEAAKAGLTQFQSILRTHPNPASLGVTKEQANDIQLGKPLDVQMVYRSDIQQFDGSKVITHDTGSKFYPILIGNDVVSSLYVGANEKAQWAATSFGNPEKAKAISAIKGDFLIAVPALKVTFVASKADDTITVTPIVSDARFSFAQSRPIPLTNALAAMKPYALTMVTDAPN